MATGNYDYYITRNLQSALLSLRSPQTSRILWIDAFCINQSNPLEKALQVSMMNIIYAQAKEVIVWLGDDDCYSDMFVRYCNSFSRLCQGKLVSRSLLES